MAIEGQLEDVGLADICQLLAMGRKTGCLTVTDRSSFGYVYFDNGRVVYANVLNRPDRLGEILVRAGVINREDLSQAMEQQAREPGQRLGQILVARGALSEDDLLRHITIQIEEAVYHLFTWERGSFHFAPDEKPEEEEIAVVSINPESLLLEGARRVDEWSLIEKKVPSMDLIFSLDRDPHGDEALELTTQQERILHLIDGSRSVEEIAAEAGMVDFDAAKALFGLVQAGFAQRTGRKEPTRSEAETEEGIIQHLNLAQAYDRAGMLEDARREYDEVLKLEPAEGTARRRLALISLREGHPEEALEHFSNAPEEVASSYAGLRNRAYALELLERPDEALALLDRATELRAGDPDLLLTRAILMLKAKRARRATEVFRRYRAGLPKGTRPSALYYAYAILAAASAGDRDEALRLGREGLGSYPSHGAVLVNLGVVLESQGESSAAEALFLRAVSEPPAPPQGHKNLGDLAYRRGDQAGARAHFERAVRLDPEMGDDVYLKLGNLAYKDGDRDWALQLWSKALELNPHNEVVRTNLDLVTSSPDR
ncbi:MAG: tetratricopeptide repeat protein [Gemmatimonadales bacterium]|nr:MAG: tetratricopeptide repeat protein [Gemmatimonadales bacterium]